MFPRYLSFCLHHNSSSNSNGVNITAQIHRCPLSPGRGILVWIVCKKIVHIVFLFGTSQILVVNILMTVHIPRYTTFRDYSLSMRTKYQNLLIIITWLVKYHHRFRWLTFDCKHFLIFRHLLIFVLVAKFKLCWCHFMSSRYAISIVCLYWLPWHSTWIRRLSVCASRLESVCISWK